ncbi:MAG: TIGR01620 family protein [Paracoccaceae bacterium]
MAKPQGPVLIDLDAEKPTKTRKKPMRPDTAPPVPEVAEIVPTGRAMQAVVQLGARPKSRLGRWFFGLLGMIISFGLSLWAWDFVTGLVARNTTLGYIAIALVAAFLLVCLGIIVREWAAFSRLRKIDGIKTAAAAALASGDLGATRRVTDRLLALYRGRAELEWGRARMAERIGDVFDADGQLGLAEAELLAPLDGLAQREVEAAARQVATVTAIVPLALADVATALVANVRMIRRIAEIYGGRAGALGSWRLARSVMAHLVATGAVAVGDDMIGSIAGGGVLSKLSRRFGEGIINGALTARVGVAAMEVCRPLPFRVQKRPGVTGLVKRALVGLFGVK